MPTDEECRSRIAEIQRISKSVVNRLNASRSVRDEMTADAVGHVFSVMAKFDPAKGSFSTWCYAVLKNHCVSMIRREARRWKAIREVGQTLEAEQGRQLLAAPESSPVEEQVGREPRSPRPDVVPLLEGHLRPIDRLLVAAYAGLLSTVGRDVIDRWSREANRSHVDELVAVEEVPQRRRKQAIAVALGENTNWVRQRIFRAVRRLRDELGGENEA